MPSEAYYAATKADAAKAASSCGGLVELMGEQKADSVVKTTLQRGGHLSSELLQNSTSLPACLTRARGEHVREPLCCPEEKGVLLLSPAEAMDISILLKKMQIEGKA